MNTLCKKSEAVERISPPSRTGRSRYLVRRVSSAIAVGVLIILGLLPVFQSEAAAGMTFLLLSQSSNSPGATANYTFSLTTSATGALAAGSGTITLTAQFGMVFSNQPSNYTISTGGGPQATQSVILSNGGEKVVITTPVAIGNSSPLTLVANGVINPPNGSYSITGNTSSDTTPVGLSGGPIPIYTSISWAGSPNISDTQVAASGANYSLNFDTSTNGALFGSVDTITIAFPSGTTPPSSPSSYFVNYVPVLSAPTISGPSATITVPEYGFIGGYSGPTPLTIAVEVYGVINPSTAGSYTIGLSTSRDTAVVNSSTFQIGTAVTSATIALSDNAAGAPSVNWTVGFSATSGITSGVSLIVFTAPQTTTLPTTASDYVVNSVAASAVNISGTTVSITSPVSVSSAGAVSVSIANVINPTVAMNYSNAVISTSTDPAPVGLPPIIIATTVTGETGGPSNSLRTIAGNSESTSISVTFTPTNEVPGGDYISLCLPTTSYTLASSASDYTVAQGGSGPLAVTTASAASCPPSTGGYQLQIPSTLNMFGTISPLVPVTVVANGLINPSITGPFTGYIFTTTDPGPAPFTFSLNSGTANEVLNPVIADSSTASGALTTLTANFYSTAGLSPGSTVTIGLPSSFTLPGPSADYSINASACNLGTNCSAITLGSGTVTLTVGTAGFSANTYFTVLIGISSSATNPSGPGEYQATIATSADTGLASTNFLDIGTTTTTVNAPSINLSNPSFSASSNYVINTSTSMTGALSSASLSHISLFANTTSNPFPTTASDYVVDGIQLAAAPTLGGTTGDWSVTFPVPSGVSIGNSTNFSVSIASVTNPSTTGTYSIGVSTTGDDANGSTIVTSLAFVSFVITGAPTSISPGTISATSTIPGSTTTYIISFFVSSSGALSSSSAIVLAGTGMIFPNSPTDYQVHDTTSSTTCTVSTILGFSTTAVTLQNPCPISASDAVTITVTSMVNPNEVSSFSINISTSSDLLPVSDGTISISNQVALVSAPVPFPPTAGATSDYSIAFTTSPTGALTSGSTISLSTASGPVFSSSASNYAVNGVPPTAITGGGTSSVLLTLGSPIGADTLVNISAALTTNSAIPGPEVLNVATSSDTSSIGDYFIIGTAVTSATANVTTVNSGIFSNYTLGFTTSTTGSLSVGQSIAINFPEGTVLPSNPNDYSINGVAPSAALPLGESLNLTLASAIGSSTVVTINANNIGNPPALGTYTLTIDTQADTVPVTSNSYSLVAPSLPTVTAITPTGGSSAGGTLVTVTGTNFTDNAIVFFGQYLSTSVTYTSSTQLSAVAPAQAPGITDITVTTLGGTSSTSLADQFTSLAPPPPPSNSDSISLVASGTTLKPGSSVTLIASLTQTTTNSSTGVITTIPITGASISFDISSGQDSGTSISTFQATTNSSGSATFTFTNNGKSGTDTITARYLNPTTNTTAMASINVDFTLQDSVTLTASATGADALSSVTVTASCLDGSGIPLVGASVTFTVSSGPDTGQTLATTSNAKGLAIFTVTAQKKGVDVLSATMVDPTSNTQIQSNTLQITWVPQSTIGSSGGSGPISGTAGKGVSLSVFVAVNISTELKSSSGTNVSASTSTLQSQSISHTSSGQPGVTVNFSVTSGPNAGKSGTAITDSTGTATWTYTDTGGPGTDSVTGSFTDSGGIAHSTIFAVDWLATTTTTSTTNPTTTTTTSTSLAPTTVAPTTTAALPVVQNVAPPSPVVVTTSTPVAPSSPTSAIVSTPTTQAPSTSTSITSKDKSHAISSSSTGTTLAVSLPQPVSSISNGNVVTKADVKALVNAGQRGPAMNYQKGYGLGLGGGPPGPAPLADSIPSPTEAFHLVTAKNVTQNAGIALLLILLVALPATLFNSTLKEHHKTIAQSRGILRRAVDKIESWLQSLHTGALLILFSVVGSALYALVDPTFGFNVSSMAEIAGYVGAILVTTATTEIARGVYVRRRFNKIGDLRAFPLGVAIAAILVIFSRISHFEPGYVFGVFAAIVFRIEPTKAEDGRSVTLASIWLILVSALSWVIWIPVKDSVISGNHSFTMLALDSLLATVWICGLQSLLFGLIPMKYLDGDTVYHWSKAAWACLYLVIMFIFVQFIMHPSAAGFGGNRTANMMSMLYLFLGFTVFAGIFWLYFRVRHGRSASEELDDVESSV